MFGVSINWIAVLVAAVVAFVLGAAWYSPALFARAWATAQGYTPDKLKSMQAGAPSAYAVSFVCFLVMATALAVLIGRLGMSGFMAGAGVGALVWLGFAATFGIIANAYSDKPFAAFLIDSAYQFVYLLLMGGIIGAWQ